IVNDSGKPLPQSANKVFAKVQTTGWIGSVPLVELGTNTHELNEFRTDIKGSYQAMAGWDTADNVPARGFSTFELRNGADVNVDVHVKLRVDPKWDGRVVMEQPNGSSPQLLSGLMIQVLFHPDSKFMFTTKRDGAFFTSYYLSENHYTGHSSAYYDGGYTLESITGLPPDAYVESFRQGERDILSSDDPFVYGTGSAAEVIVSPSGGAVLARVSDRDGHPIHNAVVGLIPEGPLSNRLDKADTYRV